MAGKEFIGAKIRKVKPDTHAVKQGAGVAEADRQSPRRLISKGNVNFNTVAAILFVTVAIGLFVIIPSQIDKPLIQLGASQANLPPELFPQVVAGCLLVLGVWFFFNSFGIRQHNELRDLDKEALTNVVGTLVIMAGYVWLMVNLGFVVGSAIMIMVMSTYFGNRSYWLGSVIAVVIPVVVFMLFTKVLVTSLPPFPVDEFIPKEWSIYQPIKFLSNKSIF